MPIKNKILQGHKRKIHFLILRKCYLQKYFWKEQKSLLIAVVQNIFDKFGSLDP